MIEAMKQALEALEFFSDTSNSAMDKEMSEDAITSLRQAIAEAEHGEPVFHLKQYGDVTKEQLDRYIATGDINQQPKQEQDEPVAWMYVLATNIKDGVYGGWENKLSRQKPNVPEGAVNHIVPLYTTPQPKQEQNFCSRCGKRTSDLNDIHTCTPPKQEQGEPVCRMRVGQDSVTWYDEKGNVTMHVDSSNKVTTTPKQEQGEPDDEVLGFNGWGFPIEHPPKPTPANKEQIREALVFNLPLYTHPQPRKPVKFPTMIRKMWSGGEVQAWLDENVNKE